jgi:hypothetical protein
MHSDAQIAQIASSIAEFGWSNPIIIDGDGIIIAGHGRVMAARKLGLQEVPCVVLSHLTETQRRALVLADNQLALNASWDEDMLSTELQSLLDDGFKPESIGFDEKEISELLTDETKSNHLDIYTKKINSPVYQPTGPCPSISELYSTSESDKLITNIDLSDVDPDIRQFLIEAARRHTVFNFRNIAEYYAHASPLIQRLMEQSALVIIDYDKAIENGFVKLTKTLSEIVESEEEG